MPYVARADGENFTEPAQIGPFETVEEAWRAVAGIELPRVGSLRLHKPLFTAYVIQTREDGTLCEPNT